MLRALYPAALAAAVLAGAPDPAAGGERTIGVPTPGAGNISVGHAKLRVARTGPVPTRVAAKLVNPGVLGGKLVLAGARVKGRVVTATVVVAAPRPARAVSHAAVRAKVALRTARTAAPFKGTPVLTLGRNLADPGAKPGYCAAIPSRFGYVKRLRGEPLAGFSVAETARFAYLLRCREFARRAAFLAALRGGSTPPPEDTPPVADSDGDGIPDEMDEDADGNGVLDEEEQVNGPGPPVAGLGSGSLSFVDGHPDRLRFTLTIGEPVSSFWILFPLPLDGTLELVEKPAQMAECEISTDVDADGSVRPAIVCTTVTASDSPFPGTPMPLVPAGTRMTGVVSLSPAATAGMGATAAYWLDDSRQHVFSLTGP